jgi:anti-anti-sigma regulatory factor
MALAAAWTQRPYLGLSTVTSVTTRDTMHVYIHGKLTAETAPSLDAATAFAVASSLVMVVHMQAVRQMNAAGLGSLMHARRRLLEAGLSMSLAGMSLKMRFLLHAWCAQPLFDDWQPTVGMSSLLKAEMHAAGNGLIPAEAKVAPAETRVQG